MRALRLLALVASTISCVRGAAYEVACNPDSPTCPQGTVCTDDGVCQPYPAAESPVEAAADCGTSSQATGSVAAGDRGGGQVTWVALASSFECDDAGARAVLDGAAGQGTHRLEALDLSLDIPEGALVSGFGVTIRRMKEGPVAVHDELVTLMFGGVPVGANLAGDDAWPSLEWNEASYSDADWEVPGGLTAAMLNDPSFGVALRATKDGIHTVDAHVDCMTVGVRYTCDAE